MLFDELIDVIGRVVDAMGIVVIIVGVVLASFRYLARVRAGESAAYDLYRVGLGRAILLGLEFLIAGDIIRTVATSPTFQSVGILASIVLIRTFLSLALSLEVERRLPWQRGNG